MYKLQYGLTMGAQRELFIHHQEINDNLLKEMDKLAVEDAGKYDPTIKTKHIAEAIERVKLKGI